MAKISTLKRRFARHSPLSLAAAGMLPSLWEMPAVVARSDRGALGETMLHWAMRHGRADWALAWAQGGGPVSRDAKGSTPLHWMASALNHVGASATWGHAGFAEAFGPFLDAVDDQGRDVAGLLCLTHAVEHLACLARVAPKALSGCVHIGLATPLKFADAMLACQTSCDMQGREQGLVEPLARLLDAIDPPSSLLPAPLEMVGGLWTQAMWDAAVGSMASPSQLARLEARSIAAHAVSVGAKAGKAPRI